ncbi:hypothetical protein BJ508DRAFT_243855 [Ascobolus immersus RN42]|uniref:Dynein light intermediate chain n=1 Tax=Ascobolus immersus RN42 TaxID=1160509 RepID=A0A3N4HMN6_ASCIM|nr:hypothetical protein BJ508DRAFT_243855 [Ascobolus immersus RN42]
MVGFGENNGRPGSSLSVSSSQADGANEDMWSNMLSSVASSKRLPQKNLLVLGGTPESQTQFIESLTPTAPNAKNQKKPPISNEFALGYTFLDVLDSDHEDILARLSVYLLSEPHPSFTPLLKPLFTPETLPETLVVILLDWAKPWDWARQVRTWVRLLRGIFTDLDDDCRQTLDEVVHDWESKRSTFTDAGGGGEVVLALGPGEFDEPLGLPLCVVCQNSDKIEVLEKEQGYKEEQFDFILQFLRTVLLKHGASLIYTTPSVPSPLQPLLHSLLSIPIPQSVRSQSLRHNIIDRDKVLIPPHWDAWGKIRIMRDGFDVEGINKGWSIDIELPSEPEAIEAEDPDGSVVIMYEEAIRDPRGGSGLALASAYNTGLEMDPVDTQKFLATQMEILEAKRSEETGTQRGGMSGMSSGQDDERQGRKEVEGVVRDHVGPVQFNVGGIQVDADDMLKRLKDRDAERTPDPGSAAGVNTPNSNDGKSQNEVLSAFFTSLIKKKPATPKGGM